MNQLYFGDNLNVLREHIKDESVDLIYLDPPFNSKRDYNLLFKSPKVTGKAGRADLPVSQGGGVGRAEVLLGQGKGEAAQQRRPTEDYSSAQITAFEDSWHWGEQAEREFDELVHAPNTDVSEMMQALRRFLGENDMMAYLTMMANRLLQLHRVLKPTGSLYLHCDPTASHYLKIVLDGVFGKLNFKSEIIWKRYSSHSNSKFYGAVHDVIFFYTKNEEYTFNKQYEPHDEGYVEERFRFSDPDGRKWAEQNLGNPAYRPNLIYAFKAKNGITYEPPKNGWKYTRERMQQLDDENRLHYPIKEDGRLRLKSYQDELEGIQLQDVWTNLSSIGGSSPERLGYPTQKPLALLERIIASSSNEGDVVLDPFCGCGTAVHAAQKLNRQWIGIDITHLAISLIEKRLKDAFGIVAQPSRLDGAGGTPALQYEVHGTPKDLDAARDLATRDKYQFQWWAVSLVEAQPFQGKKKGADGGIDGLKFFGDIPLTPALSPKGAREKTGDATLSLAPTGGEGGRRPGEGARASIHKIVVSVKGGGLKADDIRSLMAVREREGAEIGLFISLEEPTRGMIADAASAGFYESATGKKYPRVQLLTIEGLLNHTQRAEHPDHAPDLNFKKAKAESNAAQKNLEI